MIISSKSAGVPPSVDTNGSQRILASKSFKKSGSNLCEAFTTLTHWLCTEYIDPITIEPILACHLIPPGTGNSEITPIGVGEVIRIIGNCVTKVTKQDILESSDLLQVSTEHKSGSEAAVHAMNSSLYIVMEQPTTCRWSRQFASFQE